MNKQVLVILSILLGFIKAEAQEQDYAFFSFDRIPVKGIDYLSSEAEYHNADAELLVIDVPLTIEEINNLSFYKKIKYLEFGYKPSYYPKDIFKKLMAQIGQWKDLEYLRFSVYTDTGASVSYLPHELYSLTGLKHLDVTGFDNLVLTDDIQKLHRLKSLTIITGYHVYIKTDALSRLPNLEVFYLWCDDDFSDLAYFKKFKDIPRLNPFCYPKATLFGGKPVTVYDENGTPNYHIERLSSEETDLYFGTTMNRAFKPENIFQLQYSWRSSVKDTLHISRFNFNYSEKDVRYLYLHAIDDNSYGQNLPAAENHNIRGWKPQIYDMDKMLNNLNLLDSLEAVTLEFPLNFEKSTSPVFKGIYKLPKNLKKIEWVNYKPEGVEKIYPEIEHIIWKAK